MTPAQAISAGQMAVMRKNLRAVLDFRTPLRLIAKGPSGDSVVYLDMAATRAALEGADLNISTRLLNLGVSEYDPQSLPSAAPERPAPRGAPGGGSVRRTLGVPKPPKEPA